jgi:hypothetical protein
MLFCAKEHNVVFGERSFLYAIYSSFLAPPPVSYSLARRESRTI